VRRPEPETNLDRACAWLALVAPLVVTLLRAAPSSDWRDDLPVLAGAGVLPTSAEGFVGLVGQQLFGLLPLGGRWLRASWLEACAVGLAARLVYGRARVLLARAGEAPRLTPALALAAALTAVLSPSFQLEGTALGGAALATALALFALAAFEKLPARDARSGLLLGALIALTAAESHTAAVALLAALAVHAVARQRLPELASVLAGLCGALAVALVFGAALCLRSLAPHAWQDLGFGLGQSSLTGGDASADRTTALAAFLGEIGLMPFGLAVFGLATGLLRRATRRALLPIVALVLVDLALPAPRVALLMPDPFGPPRLLAVAGLGIGAALGVQAAALALLRARLPFARPAAVLLVVFDFTLVFAGSEASALATERRTAVTNEVWTDEGLGSLPPRALLLARSEAIAWRLWSAQLVRGERPDIVVVPTTLLERGALRRRLLAAEPALAPLLRDIALGGKPSEYALTTLADARPLFVELDASWDERLSDHIVPQSFWLRFRANPVGRSDRNVALARAGTRFDRVVSAVLPGDDPEPTAATRAVVIASLRQRALFLAARHDRETALETATVLERLAPKDAVAERVRRELARKAPGEVAVLR
jgi:hypothetical protein